VVELVLLAAAAAAVTAATAAIETPRLAPAAVPAAAGAAPDAAPPAAGACATTVLAGAVGAGDWFGVLCARTRPDAAKREKKIESLAPERMRVSIGLRRLQATAKQMLLPNISYWKCEVLRKINKKCPENSRIRIAGFRRGTYPMFLGQKDKNRLRGRAFTV